jgi:hypothetical protein
MSKKTIKVASIGILAGMMFQFGGCLNVRSILTAVPAYLALEFVSDNDGIFDLFESGNVAAAE